MRNILLILSCLFLTNVYTQSTVKGTLTIPFSAPGEQWVVIIDTDYDGDNGFLRFDQGPTNSETSFSYSISNVNAGTYYIYAVVDLVGTMDGIDNGDLIGLYGTGLKPAAKPNAVVPSSGTVTFDIVLQVWQWDPLYLAHLLDGDFRGASAAIIADLNNDGFQDIAGVARSSKQVSWWENDGSQNFIKRDITSDFDDAFALQAADLDNDGDQDLVGGNFFGKELTWWENAGDGTFEEHMISEFKWAQAVFTSDVDNDGWTDIISFSKLESEIAWWRNNEDGSFTKNFVTERLFGVERIFPVDLDTDGDLDVLAAAFISGRIVWYENDGQQNFELHEITNDFEDAYAINSADFDNDGDMDIVCSGLYVDKVTVFENMPGNVFVPRVTDDSIAWTKWLHCADLNGDSRVDILAVSDIDNYICWYENLGDFEFNKRIIQTKFASPTCVNSGDLDQDGDLDLVGTANQKSDVYWWENLLGEQTTPVISVLKPENTVQLFDCKPNPASIHVDLSFYLPQGNFIKLAIYGLNGVEVTSLIYDHYSAGYHSFAYDCSDLSPGLYFYTLHSGDQLVTKKLLIQ